MDNVKTLSFPAFHAIRIYISLTKPGIILGNAITAAAGFALASKGHMDLKAFMAMLFGLCCIMASGCVFNNYIDRNADAKMQRTKQRALACALISSSRALFFACLLCAFGVLILTVFSSLLVLSIALLGLFVYVFAYSFLKYHSMYATWVGSIAGAVPPVVGYCAISQKVDTAALLLFLLIATWQLPHFFAIAIYRLKEYGAALIPVLPRVKGIRATKMQMFLYILAFMAISSMLTFRGYVGYSYLIVSLVLGLIWLGLCIKGFKCTDDTRWAKAMFFFSLVVVMGICSAMVLSVTK